MKFVLEKHIPGQGWFYEGTYSEKSINSLARCCFEFGSDRCIYDDVRITIQKEEAGNA